MRTEPDITLNGSGLAGRTGGIQSEPIEPTIRYHIYRPADRDVREAQPTEMPLERLYPSGDEVSPILFAALRLLSEALELAEEARDSQSSDQLIAAGDAILHIKGLLPELFFCRSIGDGFGAIVNAIICALDNLEGGSFSEEQVGTLAWAFRQLHSQPFMAFDAAVDLVMTLEDAGFVVEPKEFRHLSDWIDE